MPYITECNGSVIITSCKTSSVSRWRGGCDGGAARGASCPGVTERSVAWSCQRARAEPSNMHVQYDHPSVTGVNSFVYPLMGLSTIRHMTYTAQFRNFPEIHSTFSCSRGIECTLQKSCVKLEFFSQKFHRNVLIAAQNRENR